MDNYIITTDIPCIYCGNKQASIDFEDAPHIVLSCTNCECRLNFSVIEIVIKIAKEHWGKLMSNTAIKKGNCPHCNQDWSIKGNIEFSEYISSVMNGEETVIICKNCRGISPDIKLTKEEISLIETQND